jgi:simple sugar transport system permease protein
VSTEAATGPPKRHQHRSALHDFLLARAPVLSIAAFFALVCLYFASSTGAFLSDINLLNLLRQSAPILIVGIAMTFVVTTGGIDLSVGSTVALVNALAAISLQAGVPWPAVVLLMLALGAVIGAVQGWFVAYEGIPAFIVTLAGLSTLRGIALLLTKGYSIPIAATSPFVEIGRGWFFGIPLPAALGLLVALAGGVALAQARYGRYVTRRAGIAVRRVILSTYVLTGLAAALAGIVIAARLGSGSSNAAVGFELDVIAAVVLGGTSLMGGSGTVLGTVLGSLTIAVIGNGLILSHISPFFTQIVTGAIILAAIWLNTRLFATAGRVRLR